MRPPKGEYLFIYNSGKLEERRAKGYVMALDHVKINEKDIYRDPLTEKQIAEVALMLDIPIAELYYPDGSDNASNFSEEELLTLMAGDPFRLKSPIIISREKSFILGTSYELVKEKMEIQSSSDEHAENKRKS